MKNKKLIDELKLQLKQLETENRRLALGQNDKKQWHLVPGLAVSFLNLVINWMKS